MLNRGWTSRGYLPHLDACGALQSVTFRLDDAVPRGTIEKWRIELDWRETLDPGDPINLELQARILEYEDRGYGECLLRRPAIARIVEDALLYFDGERYRSLNWCIMPNHVHWLLEQQAGFPLASVMRSIKSFTGRRANEELNRRGQFWQRDYFDRYIRNWEHYVKTVKYIENNPVKARLVARPEDWEWSSARRNR